MKNTENCISLNDTQGELDALIASETNIEGFLTTGHDIDIASNSVNIGEEPIKTICNTAKNITTSFINECKQYKQSITSTSYDSLSNISRLDYPILHKVFTHNSPSMFSSILFLSGSLAVILRMRARTAAHNNNRRHTIKTPIEIEVDDTFDHVGNYDINGEITNDHDIEDNTTIPLPKSYNILSYWRGLF